VNLHTKVWVWQRRSGALHSPRGEAANCRNEIKMRKTEWVSKLNYPFSLFSFFLLIKKRFGFFIRIRSGDD
jgi:hypothetical protein